MKLSVTVAILSNLAANMQRSAMNVEGMVQNKANIAQIASKNARIVRKDYALNADKLARVVKVSFVLVVYLNALVAINRFVTLARIVP